MFSSFCAAAGAGAVAGYDGYQCACETSTLGVVGKSDAEEEMVRFPWDIVRYEYRTDSHGAGKWRGAPGVVWEAVNEGRAAQSIGGPWNGFHTQAPGQQGGEPTPLNQGYVLRGSEKTDIVHPHLPLTLLPGDHLVTLTGGGAGVGQAFEQMSRTSSSRSIWPGRSTGWCWTRPRWRSTQRPRRRCGPVSARRLRRPAARLRHRRAFE